jgi:hypothetical protein
VAGQEARGGKDALAAKAIPGRPPKLGAKHLSPLYELIVGADPRQLSFELALWTREMIWGLIWPESGVKLTVVSVIAATISFSCNLVRKETKEKRRTCWC